MCEYIKDDGEQCGIDNHDGAFCHQHEETRFAALWRLVEEVSVSDRGTPFGTMETVCEECEARLRRTERMRDHANLDGRIVFEALVECDCETVTLGTHSEHARDIPDGWLQ